MLVRSITSWRNMSRRLCRNAAIQRYRSNGSVVVSRVPYNIFVIKFSNKIWVRGYFRLQIECWKYFLGCFCILSYNLTHDQNCAFQIITFQLLERVVRSQRLGSELSIAVKRQSVKIKKPSAVVLEEYSEAKTLNDKIKYIVDALNTDYPHLHDKFETILNTLDIMSPDASPRLLEQAPCDPGAKDPGCKIHKSEPAQKPYCACPGINEHIDM